MHRPIYLLLSVVYRQRPSMILEMMRALNLLRKGVCLCYPCLYQLLRPNWVLCTHHQNRRQDLGGSPSKNSSATFRCLVLFVWMACPKKSLPAPDRCPLLLDRSTHST